MEIVRLKKEHYDELIALMNKVFSIQNKKEMDFEKDLPKMCVRDDEHVGKHFGIFEDGKLVSAAGIYPLPIDIAGKKLLFSTVGNVVTDPDYEGRGYMSALLDRAMQELQRIGADASRLGGLRQRYNRFGYELCGTRYVVTFSARNHKKRFPGVGEGVSFQRIEREDTALLQAASKLHRKSKVSVERGEENGYEDVYLAMKAWRSIPYAAFKDGRMIGYLCVNERGDTLFENHAVDTEAFAEMICAWQTRYGATIYFYLPPYEEQSVRLFFDRAEMVIVKSPSHFKIINWEGVTDALMKLKATYTDMADGEVRIAIKDYGVLRLYVNGESVGCERVEGDADVELDRLQAARYLFGPLPPAYTAPANRAARDWLPLPLSWDHLDRV